MTRAMLLVVLAVLAPREPGLAQAPAPSPAPTDIEIVEAVGAIERADGYDDLTAAVERHAAVLSSPRTIALIDARLQDRDLDDAQRGLLLLERQLSLDARARGAAVAARLLSVRLIASYALLADSPQQLAAVLERFSAFATVITPQLVTEALNTPGNSWPAALRPLMEQLARDWPARGALAAATRMAEAAAPPPVQPSAPAPARGTTLNGHWRSTRILFDQPQDEHMVLRPDGTAETWMVTADNRTPVTRGRWRAEGTTLLVDWQDGRQWGQPFTFYEGQLVFPNVANGRQFWERIE